MNEQRNEPNLRSRITRVFDGGLQAYIALEVAMLLVALPVFLVMWLLEG